MLFHHVMKDASTEITCILRALDVCTGARWAKVSRLCMKDAFLLPLCSRTIVPEKARIR